MKEIQEILNKIGLTKQESKTYVSSLELQEARSGKLCEHAEIASSNIYKTLSSLIKKGLVSYRIQNNIKIFAPSPPETLNDLFLEKEKDLEDKRKEVQTWINNLGKKSVLDESKSRYKYYEGFSGVKSMWHEVNSLMNKYTEVKVYTRKKEAYDRLVGFFDEHHKLRKKLQVKEKIILPLTDIPLAKKRKDKFTEVKLANLQNEAEWGVMGDVLFMEYLSNETPKAFLIKDHVLAQTFKQVFDDVWKTAKTL